MPTARRCTHRRPDIYWRLDETSGTKALDTSRNTIDGTYSGGVAQGTASPVAGASGTAVTFDGSTGTVGSQVAFSNPTVYSESRVVQDKYHSRREDHRLRGQGERQLGQLRPARLHGQLGPAGVRYLDEPDEHSHDRGSYNDGLWHQVVATQGPSGMNLYVDGQPVAWNPQTQAQSYTGYWRVGGDTSWEGDSSYFGGTIDEVAIYATTELTPFQVLCPLHGVARRHRGERAAGRGIARRRARISCARSTGRGPPTRTAGRRVCVGLR